MDAALYPNSERRAAEIDTPRRGQVQDFVYATLAIMATVLLVGQIVVGTSISFSFEVYGTLLIVLATLRIIGLGSFAGVLIAYFVFRYVVFAEFVKTILGQPGDSNLAAAETTISVLLVGITSMCVAAIVVAQFLGNRRIITISPSIEVLANVRNISFSMGILFFAVNAATGLSEEVNPSYGGIIALTHQLSSIIYLAVIAEVWRVLTLSNGKRSYSSMLLLMFAILTIEGFLGNSKEAVAAPMLCYLIGSISYRGYMSRRQLLIVLLSLTVGVLFIYPAIQTLRNQRSGGFVAASVAADFVSSAIADPAAFFREWQEASSVPRGSAYDQALNYLGSYDDLTGRFMLIANTDVIVAAVNTDGRYSELLGMGLLQQLPTFLAPDKLRVGTADILTWHYGLRTWGVNGAPTIGILADSYANMGWLGVIIFPFVVMVVLFTELQLFGTRLGGNFVSSFLLYLNFHGFSEINLAAMVGAVVHSLPLIIGLVLFCIYLADLMAIRQARH